MSGISDRVSNLYPRRSVVSSSFSHLVSLTPKTHHILGWASLSRLLALLTLPSIEFVLVVLLEEAGQLSVRDFQSRTLTLTSYPCVPPVVSPASDACGKAHLKARGIHLESAGVSVQHPHPGSGNVPVQVIKRRCHDLPVRLVLPTEEGPIPW